MTSPTIILPIKLAVFIDYWNFQLACNTYDKGKSGTGKFEIDWKKLNNWVVKNVAAVLGKGEAEIQHIVTHIYTSYNPKTPAEQKYKKWTSTFLDIQPGIKVTCLERRAKGAPDCPSCHNQIAQCPSCNSKMDATEEKGVDTRLSVQMLDLAVNNAFDCAVIITHDSDMVPAVEFVQARGKVAFHFGFTPVGAELRKACSHNFDMKTDIESLRR
ncbi:NYN domain-containing protein [Burkholderia cenocepacia]|uniref:NYN domain-containing protein n=1 Tax=Burkholderia cenocepacia TaxID=95486 RepID=UPI002B24B5AD|nr:NYN domain-containing protein [Burkholderia cenocepacia]MEB2600054.1 NYN domain-containing protein [Burkholderia cenocepacia]MEB2600068.1 NYN domain-containing protein [Burkholderia cenocepacia]